MTRRGSRRMAELRKAAFGARPHGSRWVAAIHRETSSTRSRQERSAQPAPSNCAPADTVIAAPGRTMDLFLPARMNPVARRIQSP
jgi:hypothetical protein